MLSQTHSPSKLPALIALQKLQLLQQCSHPLKYKCAYVRGVGQFLVAQMVKNLPAIQKTWVGELDPVPQSERPPGEGNAIHSSILAWKIPWTEEPGGHNPKGCKESDTTERLTVYFILFFFFQHMCVHKSAFF